MDKFHEELMEMYGNHQRFWLWWADNLDKARSAWPEFVHKGGKVKVVYCFACEWANYARDFMRTDVRSCTYCPIDWQSDSGCNGTGSPYADFNKEPLPENAPALARQIANLPLLPELLE